MLFRITATLFTATFLIMSPVLAQENTNSGVMRLNLDAPILFGNTSNNTPTPPDGSVQGSMDLTLDPTLPPLVELGAPFTGTLSVTNGVAPYTYWHDGQLPTGLLRTDSSIYGNFLAVGPQSLTVGVRDTEDNEVTKNFSFEVLAPHTLSYDDDTLHGRVGYQISAQPTVTGAREGHTISLVSGSLPVDLSENGSISGTPQTAESGVAVLQSLDGLDRPSNSVNLPWTIHPEIMISPIADMSVTKTLPFSSPTPAASHTYGTLSWSVSEGTLPDGLLLDADGRVTGTPTLSATDQSGIRLSVSDAIGTTPQLSAPFSISVAEAPPPTASYIGRTTPFVSESTTGTSVSLGKIANLQVGDLVLLYMRGVTLTLTTWPSSTILFSQSAIHLLYKRATQADIDNGFTVNIPKGSFVGVVALAYRNADTPILDKHGPIAIGYNPVTPIPHNLSTRGLRLTLLSRSNNYGTSTGNYYTFHNIGGLNPYWGEIFDVGVRRYMDILNPKVYYNLGIAAAHGILSHEIQDGQPLIGVYGTQNAAPHHYINLLIPGAPTP